MARTAKRKRIIAQLEAHKAKLAEERAMWLACWLGLKPWPEDAA